MSQSAVAPAPPPEVAPQAAPGMAPTAPPAPAGATPVNPALLREDIATAGAGIPSRLRMLRLLAAVVAILSGVGTGAVLLGGWYANRGAAADAAQVVRVEAIRSNLLRADAIASTTFLVGGLEPTAQRAAYDSALEAATKGVADAARAQEADSEVLGALNTSILRYAGLVEQARANNRQGLPVGAGYLRTASQEVRATSLPLLDALASANDDRARGHMDGRFPYLVLVPGLVALVLLLLTQRWVSQTFRRVLNPGLVVASALVLAMMAAGFFAELTGSQRSTAVAQGAYTRLQGATTIQERANDARANEALMLIARGSGAAYEKAWRADAAEIDRAINADARSLEPAWQAYAAAHDAIVKLDAGGQWDKAVALAVGSGQGNAGTAFAVLDRQATQVVDTAAKETTETLGQGSALQLTILVGALLAGLAAARAAWSGVSARLEEYEA